MKTIIGLDLSLNSTAIVINSPENFTYHVLTYKKSKIVNPSLYYHYLKEEVLTHKKNDYSTYQKSLIKRALEIANLFKNVLSNIPASFLPSLTINIEGLSFNSPNTQSIISLSYLHSLIFTVASEYTTDINFVTPMGLKKSVHNLFGSQNFDRSKEFIVKSFQNHQPAFKDYTLKQKPLDDIADAYFLSLIDFRPPVALLTPE